MKRKDFLRMASAGVICGGFAYALQGCATYNFVDSGLVDGKLVVNKSVFGGDEFVLLRNSRYKAPVLLMKNEEQRFSALLMECTHKQCTVKPAGQTLECPCHGSRFNFEGDVLEGPAKNPLFTYNVTHDETHVYVHLPS